MQRTDSWEKTLMLGKIEGRRRRGWDGCMASPVECTWVWASFRSWWWTEKPGVLQSMGLQQVGHNWATELSVNPKLLIYPSSNLPLLVTISLFSMSVSLFLFCNFICVIFLDFMYKWHHIIFVFLCLNTLSMIISRSIHVAINGIISFFFMAEYIPLYLYNHISFIYSSVDRHLDCFRFLAIVNSAAMNIGGLWLSELQFLSFPEICLGVGLLEQAVVLFLVF